jgi:hypothetical protein
LFLLVEAPAVALLAVVVAQVVIEQELDLQLLQVAQLP